MIAFLLQISLPLGRSESEQDNSSVHVRIKPFEGEHLFIISSLIFLENDFHLSNPS